MKPNENNKRSMRDKVRQILINNGMNETEALNESTEELLRLYGGEHLKAFIEWHNNEYPDNYIPNSRIGKFNIREQSCDKCYDTGNFYLGTTCPKCNRPFRSVKA